LDRFIESNQVFVLPKIEWVFVRNRKF